MGKEESIRLGAFLRAEREKMKLSQEEIAQKMRLRRFVIDAIENEAWDRLPPPVFVKGFVRSYARTLELDETKALDLYRLTAPPERETLKPVALPRPTHRGRALLILGVLVVVLCVLYFWHQQSTTGEREYAALMERPAPASREQAPFPVEPGALSRAGEDLEQATSPAGGEGARSAPESPSVSEKEAPEDTIQAMDGGMGRGTDRAGEAEPARIAGERVRESAERQLVPPPQPESLSPWLILTGEVKETTWVSIRVDGSEPKEYMFQPGAKPQWKGREEFELIIGNAAGIQLDLEGKIIDNLGRPGQVVRLRLP